MHENASFLCVDDSLWHPSADAQVVFGRQHLDDNHGTTAIVGRCRRCGQDLPEITIKQPYELRAGDQAWRIVLCWSATQHIFVYRLEAALPTLFGLSIWSVNGYFELSALRKVLQDLQGEHVVSQGEVDEVRQLLNAIPAGEIWSRLVGA